VRATVGAVQTGAGIVDGSNFGGATGGVDVGGATGGVDVGELGSLVGSAIGGGESTAEARGSGSPWQATSSEHTTSFGMRIMISSSVLCESEIWTVVPCYACIP
jgi:hypothetical protein